MSKAYTSDGKRRSSQTHARRSHKCGFCEAVSYGNGGKVAHARRHVREGIAVELEKHWPYPMSPSRLFLPVGDAERIARFVEDGYLIVRPQPTGQGVEAEVTRLTAERDAAIERLERVIDQWRETGRAVISEMNRAGKAEAERDALAGLLAEFVDSEPCSLDHHGYCQSHGHLDEGERTVQIVSELRDALAGSEADTTDTQPTNQEDQS